MAPEPSNGHVQPRAAMTDLNVGVVGNGTFGCIIDNKARCIWCCMNRYGGDPIFNSCNKYLFRTIIYFRWFRLILINILWLFFISKFKIALGLLNNGSEETGFFDISIDGFERSEQQLETNFIHNKFIIQSKSFFSIHCLSAHKVHWKYSRASNNAVFTKGWCIANQGFCTTICTLRSIVSTVSMVSHNHRGERRSTDQVVNQANISIQRKRRISNKR